jgi:hypothetical protein
MGDDEKQSSWLPEQEEPALPAPPAAPALPTLPAASIQIGDVSSGGDYDSFPSRIQPTQEWPRPDKKNK